VFGGTVPVFDISRRYVRMLKFQNNTAVQLYINAMYPVFHFTIVWIKFILPAPVPPPASHAMASLGAGEIHGRSSLHLCATPATLFVKNKIVVVMKLCFYTIVSQMSFFSLHFLFMRDVK
jgi:hypothetical protein